MRVIFAAVTLGKGFPARGRTAFASTITKLVGFMAALLVLGAQLPPNRPPNSAIVSGPASGPVAMDIVASTFHNPAGSIYKQMDVSAAALQANSHDFMHVALNQIATPILFSDLTNKIIALADYGLKSIQTTGGMSAGSNQLVLPTVAGFSVGDTVIVAVGGEAGGGLRGTLGVGGTWPQRSYATLTAMKADTAQPIKLFAWVRDSSGASGTPGDVYQWNGNAWKHRDDYSVSGTTNPQYYTNKAIPKALTARITAIGGGGRVLTLDAVAAATTTNAGVYFDNQPILNSILQTDNLVAGDGMTVSIPSGSFAVSDMVQMLGKTNWILRGLSQSATTLFSPPGASSAMVLLEGCNGCQIDDVALVGNATPNGYGLQWGNVNGTDVPGIGETFINQGTWAPSGFLIAQSDNVVIQDVTVTNVFQHAAHCQFSNNCALTRVTVNVTEPIRQYVQWQIGFSDTTGGTATDCVINSAYLTGGFEGFRSKNIQFIRPIARNATFAMNSSGGFLVQDANLTFTAFCQFDAKSFSRDNPIFDINDNIDDASYLSLGGTVTNFVTVQQGYINSNNDILRGIVVNRNNTNITVNGTSYTAPDWAPSSIYGPWGFDSAATNTKLSNFSVLKPSGGLARPAPKAPNISIGDGSGGSITNCRAKVIVGP
jgi:hypothetical protein